MKPYHTAPTVTLYNAPALDVAQSLPDDSVDLIVWDKPYYKVKSDDWDNQWKTPADFLAWVGTHLTEFQRILKANGRYYGFARPQMAARVEVLTGEHFNVLNSIRWVKDAGWHKKADEEGLRAYLRPWESVIFAEHHNADNTAKGEAGYVAKCDELRGFVFEPLRAYLDGERKRAGFSDREMRKHLGISLKGGGLLSHYWGRSQWMLPTREHYEGLQELFNRNQPGEYLRREYEELRREYEELRQEYEALRRPFNAHKDAPYTDVWDFPTVAAHPGKHPCAKPPAMFRHIVEMSSKPGGVVFDPMCGSGGSALASRNLGRAWIGGDTSAHWCGQTVKRLARNFDDWQPKATGDGLAGLPMFAQMEVRG